MRSASCASRACRRSLPPDALDALPEAPGVYRFYGDNPLPLYIGKSINLRERVGAHFSQRLAQRDRPAAVAGDPPHRIRGDRRRARRAAARSRAGQVADAGAQPRAAPQGRSRRAAIARRARPPRFMRRRRRSSRDAARQLRAVRVEARGARDAARRSPPSIGCAGRGSDSSDARRPVLRAPARAAAPARASAPRSAESHDARLADALAPLRHPARGRCAGAALVRERAPGERTDVHVLRDWCWLGTARDDGELAYAARSAAASARSTST